MELTSTNMCNVTNFLIYYKHMLNDMLNILGIFLSTIIVLDILHVNKACSYSELTRGTYLNS